MVKINKEQLRNFDRWAAEQEAEMFEVEKFKQMGKEKDFIFQTLVFMGEASHKMSLAFTLSSNIDKFPSELTTEFREIAKQYHELQEKIRSLR